MNFDAFSSSQVESKTWLVSKLEEVIRFNNMTRPGGWNIWILAGWYGVTNFILRTRGHIPISKVRSFDLDPECEPLADKINNLWVWRHWEFKAHTADANELDYTDCPDIVINSSVEHIDSRAWYDRIPKGTMVVLQGNDMPHEDHVAEYKSLEEFEQAWPLSSTHFSGIRRFQYDDWAFNRYMIIGEK